MLPNQGGKTKSRPNTYRHDSLISVSEPLKDTIVRDAIEQNFMGSSGLFKQSNIASRRLYNVKQWKELCESPKYATPDFFKSNAERDQKAREERKAAAGKRPAKGAATRAAKRAAAMKKEETPALSVTSEAPTMEDHDTMKDQPAEHAPEDVSKADITMDTEAEASTVIAPPSPATSTEQETQQGQQQPKQEDIETQPKQEEQDAAPATPAKIAAPKDEVPGTDKSESKAGETSTKKKRRGREEDQEDWDKEWEKFDYTSLPHGMSALGQRRRKTVVGACLLSSAYLSFHRRKTRRLYCRRMQKDRKVLLEEFYFWCSTHVRC